MTAAQNRALEDIKEIMRAHFDAGVVVARVTDENGNSQYPICFGGNLSEVIGLAHMAKEAAELKFRMRKMIEEEKNGDEESDYGYNPGEN
jgi:hypothetical protein